MKKFLIILAAGIFILVAATIMFPQHITRLLPGIEQTIGDPLAAIGRWVTDVLDRGFGNQGARLR